MRGTTRARGSDLVAGLLALVISGTASADTLYKFNGRDIPPYESALLYLTFSGADVSGELRPLLGASGNPIKVSGTNSSEGRLDLQFELPNGAVKRTFKKSADKWRISWESSAKYPDTDAGMTFYRYPNRSFSEAAMTFTDSECPIPYSFIELIFPADTTEEQATAFFKSHPDLAKLPTSTQFSKDANPKKIRAPMATSFQRALREFRTGGYGSLDISVPIGSEPHVVQELRKSGLVQADLDRGGCGELERDYFGVDDPQLFSAGSLSWPKLETYFEDTLKAFAGHDLAGNKWNFRIGQARVVEIRLPTKPTAYHVKMYVASEITRNVEGWWDSFNVTMEPFQERSSTQSELSIVVTVERLKSAKRSWFNPSPPDDTYFTKELTGPDEGEVTRAIRKFFQSSKGR